MVTFRPVTADDLLLLANWLARPHWREWWGEPETELGYFREMIEGKDTTRPFIFQVDGKDKGYIQIWYVADYQSTEWAVEYPWLKWLPPDTVGVDLSIADAAELSKGMGSAALRVFVRKLRDDGHNRIIIDPDPANHRAVKAYRKAGFRDIAGLLGRTGDSLLMEHIETEGVS